MILFVFLQQLMSVDLFVEFDCIVDKFLCMQDKLSASAVGSIVGMKSEEIQQIASHYEEKVSCQR